MQVWMTVFSRAAGIFLSFERLVYFIVSKHSVLNSLIYKMTQFKFMSDEISKVCS